MIIKAAKRIFNSDKICLSYSDLNLGVTFFGTQCIVRLVTVYFICKKCVLQVMEFESRPIVLMEFASIGIRM